MDVELKIMLEEEQLSLVFINGVIITSSLIARFKKSYPIKVLGVFCNKLIEEISSLINEIKQEYDYFTPYQIVGVISERYNKAITEFLNSDIEEIITKNYTIKQFYKPVNYGKFNLSIL